MSVYPNFVKLWNFGAYSWFKSGCVTEYDGVLAGSLADERSIVWLFHNEPNISRGSTLERLIVPS